jgi:hypothetical protein
VWFFWAAPSLVWARLVASFVVRPPLRFKTHEAGRRRPALSEPGNNAWFHRKCQKRKP